jgi:hypothetical protein
LAAGVVATGVGALATPASEPLCGAGPAESGVTDGTATHVQLAGHSASAMQVVALGWQYPGNDEVVVQIGGVVPDAPPPADGGTVIAGSFAGSFAGTGALGKSVLTVGWLPVEPLVPEPAAAPLPPQFPETVGSHVKAEPQSASTLQGSCHLKVHRE